MRRQLAQARPSNTTAASLFSVTARDRPYNVDLIIITNVSNAPVDVYLFHDVDGTTYDETTALIWNKTIDVGGFLEVYFDEGRGLADYQQAGSIGIKVDTADGANFTAYGEIPGEEISEL